MATSSILLIEPSCIRNNEQTALNNYYQSKSQATSDDVALALYEYRGLKEKLEQIGVEVLSYSIGDNLNTPDAHFPNNWISMHQDGSVVLYPMFAENRRLERRESVLKLLKSKGFTIDSITDYSYFEKKNLFLEGTGSLVLDRKNKLAFCAISDRANEEMLQRFCLDFNYSPISFGAFQTVKNVRKPIYHTNVMMCIAEKYATICLEAIDKLNEKERVLQSLESVNKKVIEISQKQLEDYAGNMLEVADSDNQSHLVMSSSAFESLTLEQKSNIEKFSKIVHSPIPTIEKLGGGSVRCMMAEIYLPRK